MAYKLIGLRSHAMTCVTLSDSFPSTVRSAPQAFALRLIAHTDRLHEQPESGKMIPEHHVPHIREILCRPYRIVYRVNHERKLVEIARGWHAARGTLEVGEA